MRAAVLVAPLLVASCAPTTTVDERGRTVEHHFGYVRVIKPPGIGGGADFSAEGVETYGVRVASGLTLGYTDTQRISVPLDCRVVAIVRDRAQLDHLIDMLNLAEGQTLCATVSPE